MHRYDDVMLLAPEPLRLLRSLAALAALVFALILWTDDAEAGVEKRLGLDGVAAHAAPILLADAVPSAKTSLDHPAAIVQSHPGVGTLVGLFSRGGLVAGFAAGFLGAGLLGLLFGQGLYGGLSGVASFLGLLFQLALMLLLGRVIWMWWNGRNAPIFAGLSPRQQAEAYFRSRNELSPGVYPPPGVTGDGEIAAPNNRSAATSLQDKSQR